MPSYDEGGGILSTEVYSSEDILSATHSPQVAALQRSELLAIWTPLKTKLSTGGGLTTSEFVCTTEQRDRSREKLEKAIDLAYTTLMHVQLCSHAHLIMWLAHCTLCKQQLAADCS